MESIYLINNTVEFHVERHLLVSHEGKKESVILNTPASRCLHLLIQRQHSIISQQEFFEEVWSKQGACVSANTFYQNISILRRGLLKVGLGDEIVKTVARKGLTLTASTTITVMKDIQGSEESCKNTFLKGKNDDKDVQAWFNEFTHSGNFQLKLIVPGLIYQKNKGVFITGFSTFLFMLTLLYFFFQFQPRSYFTHYQPVELSGECTFYTERKNNNKSWIISFIKANGIICDTTHYSFNYLTTYDYSNRYSLISCKRDINGTLPSDCISYYALQKK